MSKIAKSFNVHNLVTVEISAGNLALLPEALHQLREFESDRLFPNAYRLHLNSFTEYNQSSKIDFQSEGYILYSDGAVRFQGVPLIIDFSADILRVYCDTLIIPLNCLMQICLSQRNATLIHSAGLSYNNQGYLFVAHGGVGKTMLVADALSQGAKLLGDDLVIVHDGQMLSYPIDFSVYPYHRHVLPLKNTPYESKVRRAHRLQKLRDVNPFHGKNNILDRLYSGLLTKAFGHTCINVPPRVMFSDCFCRSVKLSNLILLKRGEVNNLKIESFNIKKIADFSLNVLLNEWHASAKYFLGYMSLNSHGLSLAVNELDKLLNQQIRAPECYQLTLPLQTSKIDFAKVAELVNGARSAT